MRKNNWNFLRLTLALFIVLTLISSASAQTLEHFMETDISPLRQGDFYLFSKKPEAALNVFKSLWTKEPQNNYAVRGIVRSYRALGKLPEAASFLKQTLEENTQSSAAAYGLGYTRYLQNRFEDSKGILLNSLRFNPANALALNNLGAVLVELKRYEDATKNVKEAIHRAPGELMFYRNLQLIYVRSGQADKFEEEYRQHLQTGPRNKAKGYGLVLAQQLRQKSFKLYADGKLDETLNAISGMLKVYQEINHPPGIVAGLFSLAILYEEQGALERAIEKYQEVLKINPRHLQAQEKLRLLEQKKSELDGK